ncbi:MAG: redoxin domain-containing protein [Anaerolineae bacterium]|nr:redoxin domain-containing protein [Anaerolineae bacterium]
MNCSLPASPLALPAGMIAPDFRLQRTPHQTVALSSFRGQPVILAFYVADWHPVCTDQLALYQEFLPEFQPFNAILLGISGDSPWSHLAFARDYRLTFPLLSDSQPKGAVAQAYGVYRPQEGLSERALFVIDAVGIIRWSYLAPVCVNPGVDGILTALEKLTTKQADPG